MADNTLTNAIPQLLAQGLLALRENCIMPRIVNSSYSAMAGDRGSSIDVPIPSAVAAAEITAATSFPANTGFTPTKKTISLNQWYEAAFPMSDKDLLELQNGFLPKQASEAVKALANNVDTYILDLYKQFNTYAGTAKTTPFGALGTASLADAIECYYKLNDNLASPDDRYMVLNPIAEGAALFNRAFHDASFGGGATAILEGKLNRKFGFLWLMDQNVKSHTVGTLTGDPDVSAAGAAIGATSVPIETDADDAVALVEGDLVKFSGHTQYYSVAADITLAATETGDLTLYQPLTSAVVADETISVMDITGAMNLAIHRDAIAFATRPLQASQHPGALISSAVDPVSGLTLRLEVTRQHKQDRFSYDILYGANVVRTDLAVRLFGA